MSNRGLSKECVPERMAKNCRKLSLPRLSVYILVSSAALVLLVSLLILVFGGAILNGYGKGKAERARPIVSPPFLRTC